MGKTAENQVTIEKLADALRTEGNIAGQITQAVRQAQQNVEAINSLEKEALEALARALSTSETREWAFTQAKETVQALAKGCRDNATECAKAANTQLPLLGQRKKLSETLIAALKPAIQGKRGADLGRRVMAAVEAFKG